jgi:hypothetical protein
MKYSYLIGKTVLDAVNELKVYGKSYRIITEGGMITADMKPDRIDLKIDDNGIVVEVD